MAITARAEIAEPTYKSTVYHNQLMTFAALRDDRYWHHGSASHIRATRFGPIPGTAAISSRVHVQVSGTRPKWSMIVDAALTPIPSKDWRT